MKLEPEFLSIEDVLDIHERQFEQFGGSGGIRDIRLLESAVAMPQSTFGGEWLHATFSKWLPLMHSTSLKTNHL
ncbi:MAG: Fic family protein [bacterium]